MAPGSIWPKFNVSEFAAFVPLSIAPTSWKSISKPLSFETICGWAELIVRLLAAPAPRFLTITASAYGMCRLDLRRERVVAEHVALVEIDEVQSGVRIHGDLDRLQRHLRHAPPWL